MNLKLTEQESMWLLALLSSYKDNINGMDAPSFYAREMARRISDHMLNTE